MFHKDEELYNTVHAEGEILSKFLKKKLDYRKGGNTGFETCITRAANADVFVRFGFYPPEG